MDNPVLYYLRFDRSTQSFRCATYLISQCVWGETLTVALADNEGVADLDAILSNTFMHIPFGDGASVRAYRYLHHVARYGLVSEN